MKSKIYLYLILFAFLLILVQYMSYTRQTDQLSKNLILKTNKIEMFRDSILKLQNKLEDESYFSLQRNAEALEVLHNESASVVAQKVEESLRELQTKTGHPLVPYANMSNTPWMLNNIKVLNHKWVLVDFSDGEYWGEMLLEYKWGDKIKFEPISHLIYPKIKH